MTGFNATGAVRAGIESDTQYGAVVPPLHLSSNYAFAGFADKREFDYTRSGNPTRALLGAALAELEGGATGVVTASGMAAVTLVISLLRPGQRIVAAHDCYGGTHRLLAALAQRGQLDVQFVDLTGADADARVRRAQPDMVWVETPSNPLLRITDLAAVGAACRDVGARYVVDNTFLSPALQTPIEFGADIVVHSTTKYINGHSDVVGGAVVARAADTGEELNWWANCLGVTGAPFDSYLTLRGLRTLGARMHAHEANARTIAQLLGEHPAVTNVYYPGLADHPGHALARGQQKGFGAMISFELAGGVAATRTFLRSLAYFSLAESLGGVESLVAHPATMTHAAMSPDARAAAGISEQLLRLSVGIEAAADLSGDLERALDAAQDQCKREVRHDRCA